jgi:hypothetical protein
MRSVRCPTSWDVVLEHIRWFDHVVVDADEDQVVDVHVVSLVLARTGSGVGAGFARARSSGVDAEIGITP